MPELPEVEATARLLSAALTGARVESVSAPGINALKSVSPPVSALADRILVGVQRRGKLLLMSFDGGLVVLVHLMSAGRLQLFDGRASPRDRTLRLLVGLRDGRQLRLREFGTRQRAWVKLLERDALADEPTLAMLGPDAWPDPPQDFAALLAAPRPLYTLLRDQHVLAGIGRSWADEILHAARLSPFCRGADLDVEQAARLRTATVTTLAAAIEHYEAALSLPIPDRLPMPLRVHRHAGEPCPRCSEQLQAIHYQEYVMCYCPACQTGGRVLKDRRLSRLLK
jgi:formamidopyrimidine-DNA glycosylase